MKYAAGILFLAPDDTALFLKRGPGGDHPNEWCWPGGTTEAGETALETAVREAIEECGSIPDGERKLWTTSVSPWSGLSTQVPEGAPQDPGQEQVCYTTFLQRVKEQFIPTINGEHSGYAWAPVKAPPAPTHPGTFIAVKRFGLDELGIARTMAAGELTSPQVYDNVTLFALRITGTGAAYRTKWKEYVWRDPSIYMNDEFLARCNGLPVIFEHPDKATLNSKEFSDRVVGTILLPYLKPDVNEVWGIAKIYDAAAIAMMSDAKKPLSTSPAVVFRDPDVNVKVELESGEKLLIEGKPSLLDHLAICERGVWDKGGEPTGVETQSIGDSAMTEAERLAALEQAANAHARADAEAGQKLDKLLTGLDSIASRLDAHEARMDTFQKRFDDDEEDDKKEQEAKDDASSVAAYSARKDDDDDDTFKKRHDAEEEAEVKERIGKGETKEMAADKAKRHRKDAEEKEAKVIADKKRKDDDARKRKDDDDDAKSRKDSEARFADIERRLPRQRTDAEIREMATSQARADQVFQAFGDAAPRPLDGETLQQYRRRLATVLKVHSPTWKGVEIAAIADEAAFGPIEQQVYADALAAAKMPADLKEDEIRVITRVDHQTGVRTITGVGKRSFVSRFKRPPRGRVGRFLLKGRQQA